MARRHVLANRGIPLVRSGCFEPSSSLAVRLAREPELHQLRVYRIGTDRMPHLGQGCGELLHAFDTQIKGRMG